MTADVIPLVPNRAPSLEPMVQLVAADLNHVNAVILERMHGRRHASALAAEARIS